MMILEQTVDIPADRRLYLELPETVPSGRTKVVLTFSMMETQGADEPSGAPETKKPRLGGLMSIEEARKTAEQLRGRTDDSTRRYAGCLKGRAIFEGDPVEIQRKMRSEWD
jgi:hypothetical protein